MTDATDIDRVLLSERDNSAIQAIIREMTEGRGKDLRLAGDFMVARFGGEAAVFSVRHLYSVQLGTGGQ